VILILKYVFLGIVTYILILPILEQIAALICQALEYLKGLLLYQSAKIQIKIDKLTEEVSENNSKTSAVGFVIPEEEEYYEEEDDE
jgi:hypothetical protein